MKNGGFCVDRHAYLLCDKLKIPVVVQIIFTMHLCFDAGSAFSVLELIRENLSRLKQIELNHIRRRIVFGKEFLNNCKFTRHVILLLITIIMTTWIFAILLLSGDIHPNPGPYSSSSSSDSLSIQPSAFNFSNLCNRLSFVHYNVQSLVPKLDILGAELLEFDVLAFTETWLNSSYSSDDIRLESFRQPERKDRVGDSHGGVIIYVKDSIHYRRRNDLELQGIESIWVQLTLKHKHVLFGLFYRPPNSDSIYYSGIEDSIHLAIDTGISDIIITGDFNFNMLNEQTSRKINTFCEQLSLFQCKNEPTNFTENSSTLLDILLVANKDHLILCGVGDPFLHQEQRYHCPIYGVFNFRKPKVKAYKRRIWRYNDGNYEHLRNKVLATDWSLCQDSDINVYAQNIVKTLNALTETCVPNKIVTFRPSDPPWLTTAIKKHIRKRKRAYRKAKKLIFKRTG